jgi:phosphotransferase system  glucose/maltose/N-acetylglucosamine-specific IIC component
MYDDLNVIDCECSFALPSFYSTLASATYIIVFNDLRVILNSFNKAMPSKIKIMLMKSFTMLLLIFQALIRIHDGAHSIEDSIAGLLISYSIIQWTQLTRPKIRAFLYKKFDKVISNKLSKIWSFFFLGLLLGSVQLWFNKISKLQEQPLTKQEAQNLIQKCP